MNLLQKWILGKELINRINEVKAYQTGQRYVIQNGRLVTPADNKQSYITEGYDKNDIIYSVINLILDKVVLPEWGLYKVVKESSLKEYQRLMSQKNISFKDLKRARELKEEAVEPLSSYNLQAGKLKELLKYANECDTFPDHSRSLFLYKLVVGDYFEWAELLKAGANTGVPASLWSLPAHYMNINVTDSFPVKPSSYELTIWNQKFSKESILHEKYVNPNWDINGQQLYGFSPLRSFLKNINRNNAAKDASYSKFVNGGVEEIIFIDDPRVDFEQGLAQAKALKIKLAEEYSGASNQGKLAISGVKTGSVHLGNSPVELGIIDSEKWDAIMFCNGYGVPPELLGLTQKTYNNVKEAEKALTMRSAMPLLISRRNSLNRKIQTDWGFKGQNIYVDFETNCFPELEVDANEAMQAISQLTMRTPNEEREAINMEARPEPEADELWVGQGRQPLTDYQASVVDEALNNQYARDEIAGNGKEGDNGKGFSKNGKGGIPAAKELLS
jgi:HK97 family phage portal protein